MASTALLLSTVVMGAFLVGLALAFSRLVGGREYKPQFKAARRGDDGSLVTSDILGLLLAGALVVVVGFAFLTGDTGMVLFFVPSAAVIGFFAWGVYNLASSRGLPTAHSVALSAWTVGVVLVGLVALNLVIA
jgi:hypothetical protein